MTASESNIIEIIERLDKIEKLIKNNRPTVAKKSWVKIGIVKQLTNWNKEQMRKARENGLIRHRRGSNGIEYLLESIDEKFIKNKQ